MARIALPSQSEPLILSDGSLNPVWYRFFKALLDDYNARQ